MSFDLYFYTRRGKGTLANERIEKFLLDNGCVREDEFPQWFYSNDSTGVYFAFEFQSDSDDPEDIEIYESFDEFDNTGFTFNLNFIRPNFFGLEAFPIVERFMTELELYALNPQSRIDPDNPSKQNADAYYSDWSTTNLDLSSKYHDEFGLITFPMEKSNAYWRYNFNSDEMQEQLGDEYFVPTLLLAQQATTNGLITLTTWTEHIPNVFPPADYFVINRKRKKLFRTIDETGVISRESFERNFGAYLEDYEFERLQNNPPRPG